jgi:AraC-like DNA-binding protein
MKDLNLTNAFPDMKIHLCKLRQVDEWAHENLPCPFWRLYWNADSGAWVQREKTRIALQPENWVLISPGAPLQTGNTNPFRHFFIHFHPGGAIRLHQPNIYQGTLPPLDQERILGLFRMSKPDTVSVAFFLLRVLSLALSEIPSADWRSPVQDPRIRNLLETVEANPCAFRNTTQLAEHAGLHSKSFSRLFTHCVGVSPYRYLLQLKIDGAAGDLLHSSDSVEHIAEKWGFSDRFHLTRHLAASRGTTPGKMRAHL